MMVMKHKEMDLIGKFLLKELINTKILLFKMEIFKLQIL